MEILADREITAVAECFAGMGALRFFEGRQLTPRSLGTADILLVRSVTRVDATLLAGSRVRFVGTATAGTDHIDAAALTRLGIAFADAPGCNARAVAEHVLTCLYQHAAASGRSPRELRVGVVGWGNVGRALTALLDALAISYAVNDPPLAERGALPQAGTLGEVLDCDVVSLHVPLTTRGEHATRGLLDAAAVRAIKPGALLINAARGGVVDEAALCARLVSGPPIAAAVDCWAGEPVIDTRLAERATYATPHIAGHTLEARLTATWMLQAATLAHLGRAVPPRSLVAPAVAERLRVPETGMAGLLANLHPLAQHSARLRELPAGPAAARGARFDEVRKRHGLRREFSAYAVASTGLPPDTVAELRALGFAS